MNHSAYGYQLGFGSNLALFISDLQNAYTDLLNPRAISINHAITDLNTLIDKCRAKKIPIFFSHICFTDQQAANSLWCQKIPGLTKLIEHSPLVDIDNRLHRQQEDQIITKQTPSAFHNTLLHHHLAKMAVDTLLCIGCSTSGCVRTTAIDALQYGYRPVIIQDLVFDRWQNSHDTALIELGKKYADVITLEALFKKLAE